MKKEFILLLIIILFFYLIKNKMKNYITPVIGGRLSAKFNEVSSLRGNVPHNGIDIAVPVGTNVLAPADGTISSIYFNDLGGKQLIITLNDGFKFGFAHLSVNDIMKKGQKFKAGDVIAKSGNTGHSTAPHLHLTVTNKTGTKVDPLKYLTV